MSHNGQSQHESVGGASYRYDIGREESCSVAVVNAVADVVGCDPHVLPAVLNDVVDADALDRLLRPRFPHGSSDLHVEFSYCNCTVSVSPDRSVLVRPTHEEHEET